MSSFILKRSLFIYLAAVGLSCVLQGLRCSAWTPVALWRVGSPATDQTCVRCIAEWALSHWATRGNPRGVFRFGLIILGKNFAGAVHMLPNLSPETSYNWGPTSGEELGRFHWKNPYQPPPGLSSS